MSKRGRHDHLSEDEKDALRRDIRRGMSIPDISRKYNVVERTVQIHKAKMEGRHITPDTKKPRRGTWGNIKLCRDRECIRDALIGSPFCRFHQPEQPANENRESIISPIPKSRLMAGR